jgi:hypothetical protein
MSSIADLLPARAVYLQDTLLELYLNGKNLLFILLRIFTVQCRRVQRVISRHDVCNG